ncbi:hypothetical protein GT348_04395 [Aristophania vespae]|uniref:Tetratricopeptide repeat protein n=1 Tax=Aristophania vespae TaxID=2697033 RepID=A0A6P1NDN2_9PROT|nr:hypothetical protein [Aristophania vespae]QHI95608.1 hypothetical protein GT348_04395 [Aristophania vespae]
MKRAALLIVPFFLFGCSHSSGPWEDSDYVNDMEVGRTVFENGRLAQAEFKYDSAFQRAFLIDDEGSIHDAGFNLATSQLRQNHVTQALKTIDKAIDALKTRHYHHIEDLYLIKTAALYRQKNYQESLRAAKTAQKSSDKPTQEEAIAFEGYNAAALKDDTHLLNAIHRLSKAEKKRNQANLMELQTLYALSHQQWSQALTLAQNLTRYRQVSGDYIAMRRALELQAKAFSGNGQSQEADRVRQQIKDSQDRDEKPL